MKINIAICLLAVAIVARAGAEMSAGPPSGRPPIEPAAAVRATPPPQPPAGYAGSGTCLVCHEDKGTSLEGTPHAQAKNPRTPEAAYGCESCHGPGQAHVDDDAKGHILKFGAMKPAEVS